MSPTATQQTIPVGKADESLFVSGYGVDIRVTRGHLVINDGIADERRETKIPRASRRISRIVVHGHSGSITLDAIKWMNEVGITLVHIDHDGTLLASTTPHGWTEPTKLRAQVLAAENGKAVEVMREVMRQKISGQLSNIELLGEWPGEAGTLEICLDELDRAETMKEIADLESLAAQNYWMCWAGLPVRFKKSDLPRIPEHWLHFRARGSSPIGFGQMNATDPINAMLNYGYAILEAETRLAILREGYDPAVGFMHTDYRKRHSLVLDLMEVGRPQVDREVLRMVQRREFTWDDFFETPNGVCRLMPELAHHLVPLPARFRTRVVEIVTGI